MNRRARIETRASQHSRDHADVSGSNEREFARGYTFLFAFCAAQCINVGRFSLIYRERGKRKRKGERESG